jgi:autotransporter translocation and assembly factor TamB
MKKIIPFTLAFLMAITVLGQKEKRNHSNFDGVSLAYPAKLIITQGNSFSIELEGDRDDLEEIRTEVRGSTLVIKHDREWSWFSRRDISDVTIYVTMKNVRKVSVSGSGKAESNGKIMARDLDLDVSGSGKIDLEVDAADVSIDISGSGTVILEGKGEDGDINISGSGTLYAEDFATDSFQIEISGSGKCEVNVSQTLDADISGSGSVYYKGDPDKVRSNISGSGRVRRI